MNTINGQRSSPKFLVIIGMFLFGIVVIPLGTGILAYFGLAYVVTIALAIISFTTSIILLIRQKRLSIYSVIALVVGLLFFASSIIELGFSIFTQNMSILDQMKFSGIIRPNQISRGFTAIGVGVVSILAPFAIPKIMHSSEKPEYARKYMTIVPLIFGILLACFGAYLVFSGFQPL